MTVVTYGRGLHQRMWRFQCCVDHFYVFHALKLVRHSKCRQGCTLIKEQESRPFVWVMSNSSSATCLQTCHAQLCRMYVALGCLLLSFVLQFRGYQIVRLHLPLLGSEGCED